MRILLVPALYTPHYGGAEIVVRKIAWQMHLAGHTVEIVTNRHPRHLPHREIIEGILVTRLYFLFPRWSYLISGRWDLWLGGMAFFPLTLLQFLFFILRFRPDVVNLHYLTDAGFFLWILRRLFRFRLIVSLHGGDVDGEPHKNHFNRWLFRAVLDCADGITACSQALLEQALVLEPTIAGKSQVIHNGVEASLFATAQPYNHPRPYLFGAGKLERHKGFDILVSAFAQVARKLPDIDLLVAGDGQEKEALQAQVHEAGLEARIQLLGRKSQDDVASLMRGAMLIVIPSRRESFGIVGLEAWASGIPIIAMRVGGLVEALEGADVTWIEPNDPANLANALLKLCQGSTGNPIRLAENQRKAQAFSWKTISEEYITIYAPFPLT
jgi:glycosyltransferase involved in cell wall biosynthesis